jgi:hypothetical protein
MARMLGLSGEMDEELKAIAEARAALDEPG